MKHVDKSNCLYLCHIYFKIQIVAPEEKLIVAPEEKLIVAKKDTPEAENNHVVAAVDNSGDAPKPPNTTAENVLYKVDLLFIQTLMVTFLIYL